MSGYGVSKPLPEQTVLQTQKLLFHQLKSDPLRPPRFRGADQTLRQFPFRGIRRRGVYIQLMLWALGVRERVDVLSWADFIRALKEANPLYGGPLWPDFIELDSLLSRYHNRLVLDFSVGWTAVAFTARGVPKERIGPFVAPTSARAHAEAPLGLYLLSADRLRRSLTGDMSEEFEAALSIHRYQKALGGVFCDPNLEMTLPNSPRDFHYRPPSRGARAVSCLTTLLGEFDF